MKISVISLGCPKNLIDSEIILGYLTQANHTLSPDWKNSDIVVLNTCAFIKSAVREAEQWIHKALSYRKKGQIKKVIIAGCLPQRFKKTLLDKFPEVDGIVGIDNLTDIPKLCNSTTTQIKLSDSPKNLSDCTSPRLLTTNHYAYLKIADGCDNFCAYCLLPSIRGRFRSRKISDAVKEATQLAQNGIKELILVAQDTTLYGKDIYNKPSLAKLLNSLVKIKNIEWIRILYTHPVHWTDALIDVYKSNPKICRYIDLPLQHISNNILKMMNRPYNRTIVERLLAKLRKISNLAIRTSFIVGFPNESEKNFDELLAFIKQQRFAHLGCFTYSREAGTIAYNLPNQIPEKVKKERYNKIMATQQKLSLERMKSFIGKTIKVIIDEKSTDKKLNYIGRTQFDAPEIDGVVFIKGTGLNISDIIDVKILSAQPYNLVGKIQI